MMQVKKSLDGFIKLNSSSIKNMPQPSHSSQVNMVTTTGGESNKTQRITCVVADMRKTAGRSAFLSALLTAVDKGPIAVPAWIGRG